MTTLQIVVLAIVQGVTEFLPISSSGHLVLVPSIFRWTDQGLAFDIAVHFGSLVAVCVYFRRDLVQLVGGGVSVLQGDIASDNARIALGIALGTVPAAIAGLALGDWIEQVLRDPAVVVVALSFFGVLMYAADRFGRRSRDFSSVRVRDALLIGVAQALALIPGTSRSGITITAAMTLGLRRQDAARFSFLLSVPVILLATVYKGGALILSDEVVDWVALLSGATVSAIVAYLSIEFFMRVVSVIGLAPFAIYRLLLAGAIMYVLV